MKRRTFLKASLYSCLSGSILGKAMASPTGSGGDYELGLVVPAKLFDGKNFWCHPRAGIIPGAGLGGRLRVVMTMTTMNVDASDVYKNVMGMHTDDLKVWTQPAEIINLAPRYEEIDGVSRPVAVADFWPAWHKKTATLLGTGHTVAYTPDWKVANPRPRHTCYATYDPAKNQWNPWKKLSMPEGKKFYNAGAGCTQRLDRPDGAILLPFYFKPDEGSSRVAVARCSFDGQTLTYLDHGNELAIADKTRGLHEPSIAHFNDEFVLTIRNDQTSFVSRSRDGLDFQPCQPWRFDDGQDLGSYNTQQHWVTHSDGLYLVYTRRGANNDHVFRHRAPLFMAKVDPQRLCVIRATEQILIPERGARLGNFGITDISPEETWVTVAEWMQPKGVQKYGSDGSIFIARIQWNKPNQLFQLNNQGG